MLTFFKLIAATTVLLAHHHQHLRRIPLMQRALEALVVEAGSEKYVYVWSTRR